MINTHFQRINIAVRVPGNVSREVMALSKGIGKANESYFVLNASSALPHITLYSPEYPVQRIPEVLETVRRIAASTKPFTAHFTQVDSHRGYIDLALENTAAWVNLHTTVVQALNPLRDGHLRAKYLDQNELKNYSPSQQENMNIFGSVEVGASFRPHLTLVKLADSTAAKEVAEGVQLPVKPFAVATLAAFTMGEHGTCRKVVAQWELKT